MWLSTSQNEDVVEENIIAAGSEATNTAAAILQQIFNTFGSSVYS